MSLEVAPRDGGETNDLVCIGDTNSYPFVCCVRLWDISAGSPGRLLESDATPAPSPVIEYMTPGHDVSYAALAPVIEHSSVASVSRVNCETHGLVNPQFFTARQVILQEIPEVQFIERTQEQIEVQIGDIPVPQQQLIAEVTTLNTSSASTSSGSPRQQSSPANTMAAVTTSVKHDNTVLVDSRCSSSLDEFAALVYNRVRQKLFDAEETTQSTVEIPSSSSASTSSDRRLDEFANMLDSCIELLTPVTAQIESTEKETERAAMLTKRMMETPLPEPPMMMEPTLMESERASSKRRRRTRYTPLPRIMENEVYLAPSTWPPARRA